MGEYFVTFDGVVKSPNIPADKVNMATINEVEGVGITIIIYRREKYEEYIYTFCDTIELTL